MAAHSEVSIPFIAGQWSLPSSAPSAPAARLFVSIPFIAGQWSLRGFIFSYLDEPPGFNPLHCGAVVASYE